jgi:hypothetical protein
VYDMSDEALSALVRNKDEASLAALMACQRVA